MEKKEAKQLVIRAGKELSQSGLIARTWGNVSCRLTNDTFAITASGKSYLTLTEDQVIEVAVSDLSYDGQVKPSSEKKIHREIYKLKQDAGFVIHTHQENASAVSAMGVEHITLDRSYEGLGQEIICAAYGLPGTKKLCSNTIEAVKQSSGKAIILRHHGAVCYGRDYEEAFAVAKNLEEACGNYLEQSCRELKTVETRCEDKVTEVKNIVWNRDPLIMEFMERETALRPYLDDFAQLIGVKAEVVSQDNGEIANAFKRADAVLVKGKGALCTGPNLDDAKAASMILSKNCKAYFAAMASGKGKPIKSWECHLMRMVYLKKYAKLGV